MDVRPYLALIWRWAWLVVLGVTLAGVTAFFMARAQTPVYSASSLLRVYPGQSPTGPNYQDLLMGERLMRTYMELLTTGPILAATAEALGVAEGEGLPITGVQVVPLRETQLIRLVVTSHEPEQAAAVANTLPRVFLDQNRVRQDELYRSAEQQLLDDLARLDQSIGDLEAQIAALRAAPSPDAGRISTLENEISQYRGSQETLRTQYNQLQLTKASTISGGLEMAEEAPVPVSPIEPRPLNSALIGALVGGLLAGLVALAIELLDDTVKGMADVQGTTGLFVLGSLLRLPNPTGDRRQQLIPALDPRTPAVEAFRALRTNLQFSALDRPLRRLLVTSPNPSEGKSLTAANLAIALAQAGQRVILVDANLRRPVQHTLFGVANNRGLTTALLDEQDGLNGAIQRTQVEHLTLLPSGPLPPNPGELLGSGRMASLLNRLAEQADIVIFDGSPILAVTDSVSLAPRTDGVLLVAEARRTRRDALRKAEATLNRVGAPLLGVVLNGVEPGGDSYAAYYASDDEEGSGSSGQARRRPAHSRTASARWSALLGRLASRRTP